MSFTISTKRIVKVLLVLVVFAVIFGAFIAPISTVYATQHQVVDPLDTQLVPKTCSGLDCDLCELLQLARNIMNFMIAFATVVAVFLFIWAGFLLITSGGSVDKASQARRIFTAVTIGFIIVLASWLIINLLMTTFYEGGNTGAPIQGTNLKWLPWANLGCGVGGTIPPPVVQQGPPTGNQLPVVPGPPQPGVTQTYAQAYNASLVLNPTATQPFVFNTNTFITQSYYTNLTNAQQQQALAQATAQATQQCQAAQGVISQGQNGQIICTLPPPSKNICYSVTTQWLQLNNAGNWVACTQGQSGCTPKPVAVTQNTYSNNSVCSINCSSPNVCSNPGSLTTSNPGVLINPTILPATPPPTINVTLSSSKVTINSGESITLTWDASANPDVASCTASSNDSRFAGPLPGIDGSVLLSPVTVSDTYSITCTSIPGNNNQTTTATDQVSINVQPALSLSFTAQEFNTGNQGTVITVPVGKQVTLTWDAQPSANIFGCTSNDFPTNNEKSSSYSLIPPVGVTTYTLTCASTSVGQAPITRVVSVTADTIGNYCFSTCVGVGFCFPFAKLTHHCSPSLSQCQAAEASYFSLVNKVSVSCRLK